MAGIDPKTGKYDYDNLVEVRNILGFSAYSISSDGRVFGVYGKQLSPANCNGYRAFRARGDDNNMHSSILVHRCVWASWEGPIPKGFWINHKNGIRSDNRLENLECDTPQYNHLHARDVLKRRYARGEENNKNCLDDLAIKAIFELKKAGWTHFAIAQIFLVSAPLITNIINGKAWKHIVV